MELRNRHLSSPRTSIWAFLFIHRFPPSYLLQKRLSRNTLPRYATLHICGGLIRRCQIQLIITLEESNPWINLDALKYTFCIFKEPLDVERARSRNTAYKYTISVCDDLDMWPYNFYSAFVVVFETFAFQLSTKSKLRTLSIRYLSELMKINLPQTPLLDQSHQVDSARLQST